GVLLQLNVPSLVGAYGQEVQAKARKLLDKGMYDCCGTDTHSAEQMDYFLESMISKKVVKKVKSISESQDL
ncbi:MAG: capsular biosynthesis protein, partial [Prevotellaceae bacterium]|nr:capsular biosynthesis protein [Prevotellaceae bacterium]